MKNIKLSENIKFYRKRANLTQSQLAELLFAGKSLISNYENNFSTPDIETIMKLADVFGVTLDELCGREVAEII